MADIRKWFMKKHDKGNGTVSNPEEPARTVAASIKPDKPILSTEASTGRKKTSKYFASVTSTETSKKQEQQEETTPMNCSAKRKAHESNIMEKDSGDAKKPLTKKRHKEDPDDDFATVSMRSKPVEITTEKNAKRLKGDPVKAITSAVNDEEDEKPSIADTDKQFKHAGRGSGGCGAGGRTTGGGRGRGSGRGSFMNFGERKDPPHKGEKEVPMGAPNCLAGLTFVISGTLDSLEREEAEDLIKSHGGRVTGSVSKKTSYLLADEDVGGRKSSRAKELGISFLSEDGLFNIILKSKPQKDMLDQDPKKKTSENSHARTNNLDTPMKVEEKAVIGKPGQMQKTEKDTAKGSKSPGKKRLPTATRDTLPWTEKYRPKVPNDIIGNQSLVKQLHDWLMHWDEEHLHSVQKGKGKKQNDAGSKKAVLLSGSPGIGKSTTAKLVSQMLGFQAIEVNASDARGKANTNIGKGIDGNTSNSIKELVSNASLAINTDRSKHSRCVLVMDEVDGMSAGDRGGVADLISSIKIAKIPIICICNDRYSQKLKSLINYCLPLNFRKPTKQQVMSIQVPVTRTRLWVLLFFGRCSVSALDCVMAERLLQVAAAEGLQVGEIAIEELGERVNGDMRMALNQLQYMSLSLSVIDYGVMRERLLSSAKDEDISPFTAVDKLFGFGGGKLRMDERIDLSMSDLDLVPLIIQMSGIQRMKLLARTAESIGDGDIINVQIRRYRQWQLSQAGSLASCIIPAALMHGHREILGQGERNFNRFGGWLGKNSTMGKNLLLLDDIHVHVVASRASDVNREIMRLEYFPFLVKRMTDPLRMLPKDAAVQEVVGLMDEYSISQEDFDTMVELSKFQGHTSPLDGVQPAVKAALTKAYKQGSSSRVIRVADLITLPGQKKAVKKRIAAILEPVEESTLEERSIAAEKGDGEESSDTDDADAGVNGNAIDHVKLSLENDKVKGMQVYIDLKNGGPSNSRTSGTKGSAEKKTTRGAGGAKRKR